MFTKWTNYGMICTFTIGGTIGGVLAKHWWQLRFASKHLPSVDVNLRDGEG